MLQEDIQNLAEVISLNSQYILFAVEENAIQRCYKHADLSAFNPYRFGPPTDNSRRHHRKEEEASHLYTGDNKSKA
jgi:hypothetical protein